MRRETPPDLGYSVLPAASFHVLTRAYDLLAGLTGFGAGFKRQVIERAEIKDGMSVLDLGCGSGVLLRLLKGCHPLCRVVGVDADPRILGLARRRAHDAGLDDIEFVCAGAERTGLDPVSFDVVVSSLVFHHLPPRAKEEAVREVARVLRPGGRFVLVDLRPMFPLRRPLDDWERLSPRLGLRTNTPDALSVELAHAGFKVEAVAPPKAWSLPRSTFALRAARA